MAASNTIYGMDNALVCDSLLSVSFVNNSLVSWVKHTYFSKRMKTAAGEEFLTHWKSEKITRKMKLFIGSALVLNFWAKRKLQLREKPLKNYRYDCDDSLSGYNGKVLVDKKKNKTEGEDLEYEKRRTDFMLRLGENKEAKKIIPINTANVWSVIKVEHSKEFNLRYVVFPREKLVSAFFSEACLTA